MEPWSAMNSRLVVSLRANINKFRTLRKAERLTIGELKETGMSLDPHGCNIYTPPDTFNIDSTDGYFQVQILGAIERDSYRSRWWLYYRAPENPASRNAGDASTPGLVYGPSQSAKERRACALNSPKTSQGQVICWGHNPHLGCSKAPCRRCETGGKATFRNFESICSPLKIYLVKRGGLRDATESRCQK